MNEHIILGIDPGYGRMGFGVIKHCAPRISHITAGCIETPAHTPHEDRLYTIYTKLSEIIANHHPSRIAIETLYFSKNTKTALAVAETRGVIILAARKQNITISEFTPLQVKMALSGYGKADKKQVEYMVGHILGLTILPKPDDAVDALAIAITAAHTRIPL